MEKISPTKITQLDERTLGIHWSDGHESRYDVVFLRGQCRCAACIDEWTHEKILDPMSIPSTVRPIGLETVGHYALHIQWSDGHASGIYPYEMLRQLCSCSLCQKN